LTGGRAARSTAQARLAGMAEVNGIGITRVGSGFGVKVNLSAQPEHATGLPEEIDGVPVVIELVGQISSRER
jgi:hypothetical protein